MRCPALLVCVVYIIGQAIKGKQNRTTERVLVYVDHVIQLLQELLRQYGTQHFIKRLEYAIQTCRDLRYLVEQTDIFRSHSNIPCQNYVSDCLRSILAEWKEYQDCQDSLLIVMQMHTECRFADQEVKEDRGLTSLKSS